MSSAAPEPQVDGRPTGLARGARGLAFGEAAALLVPLAVLPHLLRALGPDGYGHYQTVLAFGGFAGLAANPGLVAIATRRAARRPAQVARTWALLQPLRLLFALAAGAGMLAAGAALDATPGTLGLLAVQAAVFVATALGSEPYLSGLGEVGVVGRLRAVSLVVYGVGVWAFVRTPLDVLAAMLVQLASAVVPSLLSTLRLARRAGVGRPRADRRHARRVLAEGSGYLASSVMSMVYARADVLLLRAWKGAAAVGVYSACVRVVEALGAWLTIVLGAVYPRFVGLFAGRPARARALAQRALRLVLLLLLPAAVGAAAAGGPIVAWVAGAAYEGADATVALLALAVTAGAVASLATAFGLTAHGRSRALLAATAAGAAVNLATNMAAIPLLGGVGAAATTLLAQAAVAVAAMRLAGDRLGVDPVRAARPWLAPALGMGALVVALRLAGLPAWALLATGALAYCVLVVATGRLRRTERRGLAQALGAR